MEIKKAVETLDAYWPDHSQIMWGDALETVINAAVKMENAKDSLILVQTMLKVGSQVAAYDVITGILERFNKEEL